MLAAATLAPSTPLTGISSVLLKFTFRDFSLVSNWLWRQPLPENRGSTGRVGTGEKIILPTLCVSVHAFLTELRGEGYALVDGYLMDAQKPQMQMASFIFKRPPLTEEPSKEHRLILEQHIAPSLTRLSKSAGWQLCAFRNPLAEGGHGLSINCNTRVDCKSPAQPPQKYLRIVEGQLTLE